MRGGPVWASIRVPAVAPQRWSRPEIHDGLRELERVHREVEAALALLLIGAGTDGRDSTAELARVTGTSTRTARDRVKVAVVVEKVAGAGDALMSGEVSGEHLRALATLAATSDAAELLPLACVQTPEEFAATVRRFELVRHGLDVRERQQAARGVTFFDAEHGCVGLRAVLTPVEGAELRTRLQQIADDVWRAEHPDRADITAGHGGPSLKQRLADALMLLAHGEAGSSSRPSIVVVVNAETLDADIAGTAPGSGPVDLGDVAAMVDRSDLYTAVRDSSGAILNFGRTRRYATALQRLAVIVRDGAKCAYNGCDVSHERCDVHHVKEWEHGGPTDLAFLALLCPAHHPHLHSNQLRLIRDGTRWNVIPDPSTQWDNTG